MVELKIDISSASFPTSVTQFTGYSIPSNLLPAHTILHQVQNTQRYVGVDATTGAINRCTTKSSQESGSLYISLYWYY